MDISVMLADVAGVAFFTGLAAGGEFAPGFDLEGVRYFSSSTLSVDDASAAEEEGVVKQHGF